PERLAVALEVGERPALAVFVAAVLGSAERALDGELDQQIAECRIECVEGLLRVVGARAREQLRRSAGRFGEAVAKLIAEPSAFLVGAVEIDAPGALVHPVEGDEVLELVRRELDRLR